MKLLIVSLGLAASVAALSVFMYLYFSAEECKASVVGQCTTPSITTTSGEFAPKGIICPGQIILEDNFSSLNLSLWRHENTLSGGGNWEFQWYVNDRANSYVQNGIFHIKPTLTSDVYDEDFVLRGGVTIPPAECTDSRDYGCSRQGNGVNIINPIRSAKVTTRAGFAFKYGEIEVRAKMPAGDWIWPAVWMMPKTEYYGPWPRSGEIDLLEIRGNRQLFDGNVNVGAEQTGSTMHWGPEWNVNGFMNTHWTKNQVPGWNAAFHDYKLRWTNQYLEFFVDNISIGKVDAGNGFWEKGNFGGNHQNPWAGRPPIAPFDQEFYLIFNNAVGGIAYFADHFVNQPYPKPWSNSGGNAMGDFWNARAQWKPTWNMLTDDSHLQIDYIRIRAI